MRLLRDKRGNILAMTAAAIIPMIGLVGGAVDMGRLYAVKSRLQMACDAGALAGRRVMGSGRWSDNSNRANTIAQQTFDLNFTPGMFGSGTRTRSFSETDGTVTGTATAPVPMTLMRVFGFTERNIAVTCEGMMRIPNTDVMFVLDNSGSMACLVTETSCTNNATNVARAGSRINGLRTAVRCFYEALAKVNITDVTPTDCGTSADPTGGLSSQVQLRFGFVNYDNMVNVGKLLPNNFIADDWDYQSRTPNYQDVWAWSTGTASSTSWGGWSSEPSGLNFASNYSSWANISTSGGSTTTINGNTYTKSPSGKNSTSCPALNDDNGAVEYTDSGSVQTESLQSTTNDPPTYPASSQTLSYGQNDNHSARAYRYAWTSSTCRLQQSGVLSHTLTRSGTATKSISWTSYTTIANWTYQSGVNLNVSSLKAGGSNWNGTVALPIGEASGATVKLSGSNSNTTIKTLANVNVTWDGCIEERDVAGGRDMDIDTTPVTGDRRTQWRPVLVGAVWGRRDTQTGTGWSGNYTENAVVGSGSTSVSRNLSSFTSCVTPSRLLTQYNGQSGNPTAADFSSYVGTIAPNGNTYHDIGLLWGARLMSPTGIFAADNAATPGGAQIARHMIFMTDGDTAATWNNYASYGLEWWDHRQTSPSGLTNSQYETALETNNNNRSNTLCTAIKNRNITLWVISYGSGVNTTTQTRLRNCATSPDYFFSAANSTQLITKFREIADKISNLRLTN